MSALNSENWSTPLETLSGRRLGLVVTGGVAAYKAAELARLWVKAGALVRVVMTEAATRFIAPLTFEALTGQPVVWDMWRRTQVEIEHISWANWAEVLVVAPASADFIAKMAQGLADDFASSLLLAFDRPVLAAPAMNTRMYLHPATQANLCLLKERGVSIIEPESGLLACGSVGSGRLADLDHIVLAAARALGPGDFQGRRVAVSAGPTREAWDDIRFLSNRSTGRMGLSLSLAAWTRGATVDLVAGPGVQGWPSNELNGFQIHQIESTRDMLAVIGKLNFEILIMAAAPGDFRPAEVFSGKIKKSQGPPRLDLAANPDILKTLTDRGRIRVGFAAEDRDLADRARAKLKDKNLDLVVANQAGGTDSAFGSDSNHLWLVDAAETIEVGPRPKFAAAWAVLDRIRRLEKYPA